MQENIIQQQKNFHQQLLDNMLFKCNIAILAILCMLAAVSFLDQQIVLFTATLAGVFLLIISLILQRLNLYEIASYLTVFTLTSLAYTATVLRSEVTVDLIYLYTTYQSITIVLAGILATKKYFSIIVGSISIVMLLIYIIMIQYPAIGLDHKIVIAGGIAILLLMTILSDKIYSFTGNVMNQYNIQQNFAQYKEEQLTDIISVYQDTQYQGDQLTTLDINNEQLSIQINNTMQNFTEQIHELIQLLKDVYIRSENTVSSHTNISKVFNNHQANIIEYKSKIDTISDTAQDITLIVQNNQVQMNQLVELSEQGNIAINNSIVAVEKISENSKNMVDMISLIMEVAEKTNILALNAAVEASRAGKYGGGFAIVAKEIKTLSTETTQNADIINKSLQNNIISITETVNVIKNVGMSFQHLNQSIIDFSTAIDQIVVRINTLTQQNSQMSIETKNTLSLIGEIQNILENNTTSIKYTQNKIHDVQLLTNKIEQIITQLQHTTNSISGMGRKTQEKYREYTYSIKKVEDVVNDILQQTVKE